MDSFDKNLLENRLPISVTKKYFEMINDMKTFNTLNFNNNPEIEFKIWKEKREKLAEIYKKKGHIETTEYPYKCIEDAIKNDKESTHIRIE